METKLHVELIQHTPEPEKVIAAAAKLCYSHSNAADIMDDLTDESVDKFLTRLVSMGHGSPTEHASFTFAIEGVSRTLTHQLVRHRLASFSQQSQRYVNSSGFDYIIPPVIAADEAYRSYFESIMEILNDAYNSMQKILQSKYEKDGMGKSAAEKKANEDARYMLPNACETKIVVTMNSRELAHFFNVRCCNRAQWEIRALADAMLEEVQKVAPTLFKNAGPDCRTGKCGEGAMSCGEPRV